MSPHSPYLDGAARIVRIGVAKYITHPQDINAHQVGEVEEASGEHTPVVRVELGATLLLRCPVPSLIVLLEMGAAFRLRDELAEACPGLQVYALAHAGPTAEAEGAPAGGARRGTLQVFRKDDEIQFCVGEDGSEPLEWVTATTPPSAAPKARARKATGTKKQAEKKPAKKAPAKKKAARIPKPKKATKAKKNEQAQLDAHALGDERGDE